MPVFDVISFERVMRIVKITEKVLLTLVFAAWFAFSACQKSSNGAMVTFIDRDEVFTADTFKHADPLLLLIEIDEEGKLTLNRIEVGTIDDLNPLAGKLRTIFEDRARAEIAIQDVVIEMNGNVDGEHFEKLIESLSDIEAAPIRVIKSSF